MKKFFGISGKIICWFFVVLFVIMMLFGGASTVLFGLAALFVAPVEKLKQLKQKMKISKKRNVGLVAALFLAGFIFMPRSENDVISQDSAYELAEETSGDSIEQAEETSGDSIEQAEEMAGSENHWLLL